MVRNDLNKPPLKLARTDDSQSLQKQESGKLPSIQVQRSSNIMKLNNIQKLQQTVQLQKEASQTKLDSPFEASSSKI